MLSVLSIFGNRYVMYLLVVLAITGAISYKIYSLNSIIEDRDAEIITLNSSIDRIEGEKQVILNRLTVANSNIDTLKNSINVSNTKIEELKVDNDKLLLDFKNWKNKPPGIKYKTKVVKEIVTNIVYEKGNCEDGAKLNKSIGELKYEDL